MEQLNRMQEFMGSIQVCILLQTYVFLLLTCVLALCLHTSYDYSLFWVVKLLTYILVDGLDNGVIYFFSCKISFCIDLFSNSIQFK